MEQNKKKISSRGRKPKADGLKDMQGTLRKCRQKANPTPPPDAVPMYRPPLPPDALDEFGKNKWNELALYFSSIGVLQKVHYPLLQTYCQNWATYLTLTSTLELEGAILTNHDTGAMYPHPANTLRQKAVDNLIKIGTEFGMTPSSSSRVTLPEKEKQNKFSIIAKAK